jgi:hypothetical protein
VQNFNASNIKHYFCLVKNIFDAHPNLSPNHIWNIDKKGLQLGSGCKQCKKFFCLESLKQGNFYCICLDNLKLVTIIKCISPSGLSIPPSFVLLAGLTPAFIDLDVKIGAVATSPNGWTDNKLGTNWFKHTFIPFTTSHKVSNDPIILFLDGHNLHETYTFCKLAFDNNIYFVAFPSMCTCKLQPLNIVVFAQTQHSWGKPLQSLHYRRCSNDSLQRYPGVHAGALPDHHTQPLPLHIYMHGTLCVSSLL